MGAFVSSSSKKREVAPDLTENSGKPAKQAFVKATPKRIEGPNIAGTPFEVSARYNSLKLLATSSSGVTVSAFDTKTQQKVSIKKYVGVFSSRVVAVRALRELRIQADLNHKNILKLHRIIVPPSLDKFEDIYAVSDQRPPDFTCILRSGVQLSSNHRRYIMFQLFCALQYLHSSGVIHRDLKPSNLLLDRYCVLTLCGFVLSRPLHQYVKEGLTVYVTTRWYRAPEVMLCAGDYTPAVDMWACGCLLAEMLTGSPLFDGASYLKQLQLFTRLLGSPSEQQLSFITSDNGLEFMRKLPRSQPADFAAQFPAADAHTLDLLRKLLQFDPRSRLSASEALRHPLFADLFSSGDPAVQPATAHFHLLHDAAHEHPSAARDSLTATAIQQLLYTQAMEGAAAEQGLGGGEGGSLHGGSGGGGGAVLGGGLNGELQLLPVEDERQQMSVVDCPVLYEEGCTPNAAAAANAARRRSKGGGGGQQQRHTDQTTVSSTPAGSARYNPPITPGQRSSRSPGPYSPGAAAAAAAFSPRPVTSAAAVTITASAARYTVFGTPHSSRSQAGAPSSARGRSSYRSSRAGSSRAQPQAQSHKQSVVDDDSSHGQAWAE